MGALIVQMSLSLTFFDPLVSAINLREYILLYTFDGIFTDNDPRKMLLKKSKNTVPDYKVSAKVAVLHLLKMQFCKTPFIPNDRPLPRKYITIIVLPL